MYLRTPKRYRSGRKRSLRLFSARTVLFLILVPVLGYVALLIWNNRSQVREAVLPELESMAQSVQTQVAPAPTPTPTPNLVMAQAACTNAERTGNLEEAIIECQVLAENAPNDVELHFRLTHMMVITSNFGANRERIEAALEFAERTINAAPEQPHGWAVRAFALDWAGEYERALASALHARALDENYAPTYAFLGSIYNELGKPTVALDYLNQALELDTGGVVLADTFRNQGWVYSTQGNYEDALRAYQLATSYAPHYTYIAIELALNYIALGQTEEAIRVLSDALERNPQDTGVLFALAKAQQNTGNRDRAYEYYRRCLDADPNNVPCLSWLGGLYWDEGDFVTAINYLEQAINLGSTDPWDYYQLGHSHASRGRCDLGIPYLRQGYQILTERADYDRQLEAYIVSQLQSCGDVSTAPGEPSS